MHVLLGSTSTSKKLLLRKLVKTRKITEVGSSKFAVDKSFRNRAQVFVAVTQIYLCFYRCTVRSDICTPINALLLIKKNTLKFTLKYT